MNLDKEEGSRTWAPRLWGFGETRRKPRRVRRD